MKYRAKVNIFCSSKYYEKGSIYDHADIAHLDPNDFEGDEEIQKDEPKDEPTEEVEDPTEEPTEEPTKEPKDEAVENAPKRGRPRKQI